MISELAGVVVLAANEIALGLVHSETARGLDLGEIAPIPFLPQPPDRRHEPRFDIPLEPDQRGIRSHPLANGPQNARHPRLLTEFRFVAWMIRSLSKQRGIR